MENLFVSYEIAKQLKEKGFNEPCFGYYHPFDKSLNETKFGERKNNNETWFILSPLFQQVVDWFREKHNICVSSDGMLNKTVEPNALCFIPTVTTINEDYDSPFDVDSVTNNYYDTLNEAINEALKLI